MREIKFRGYDKDREEWRFGSLYRDLEQKCYYITDEYEGIGRDVVENTIGQFTGLHDKNGKEIYEGDIVRKVFYKFSNDEFGHKGFYELICKIIWKNGLGFTFRKVKENEITMPENYTEEYEEVIGNIYENPELLEDLL